MTARKVKDENKEKKNVLLKNRIGVCLPVWAFLKTISIFPSKWNHSEAFSRGTKKKNKNKPFS